MIPAMPVPQAEFTPYLLQQTGLRASLLQTSFGFAADDWDDLRQDLALDCLRRLPRFDASRGNWKGFVHGVVRNHACVLASKQARRPELQCLAEDGDADADWAKAFRGVTRTSELLTTSALPWNLALTCSTCSMDCRRSCGPLRNTWPKCPSTQFAK